MTQNIYHTVKIFQNLHETYYEFQKYGPFWINSNTFLNFLTKVLLVVTFSGILPYFE